jgi:hypothetical protein
VPLGFRKFVEFTAERRQAHRPNIAMDGDFDAGCDAIEVDGLVGTERRGDHRDHAAQSLSLSGTHRGLSPKRSSKGDLALTLNGLYDNHFFWWVKRHCTIMSKIPPLRRAPRHKAFLWSHLA